MHIVAVLTGLLSHVVIYLVGAVVLGSRSVLGTADAAVNATHTIFRRLSSLRPAVRGLGNSNSGVDSLDAEGTPFLANTTVSSCTSSCVHRSAACDA